MIWLLRWRMSTSYFPVKQGHFALSGHLSLHTCDLITDMTWRAVRTGATSDYPRPECPSHTAFTAKLQKSWYDSLQDCESIKKKHENDHIIPPKFAFKNNPPFPSAVRLKLGLILNSEWNYLTTSFATLSRRWPLNFIIVCNRGCKVQLINQVPK